jgi:peptidoglycan hydrolase-like protein with peptidoglycan-binding domain
MKLRVILLCWLWLAGVACADDLTRALQRKLKDQGFFYGEVNGQTSSETAAALRRFQIRYGLRVTGEADASTLRALGLGNGPVVPSPNRNLPPATPPPLSRDDERRSLRGDQEQRLPDEGYVAPDPRPRQPANPYVGPPPSAGPFAPARPVSGSIFAGSVYERAPRQLQENVLYAVQGILTRRGYYRADLDGQAGPATSEAIGLFQQDEGLPASGRLDSATLNELRMLPGQQNGPRLRGDELAPAAPPGSRRVYRGVWIDG